MRFAAIGLTMLLIGCEGLPNQISTEQSSFDGVTQRTLEPGFVMNGTGTFSGSDIKLGLIQRGDKMTMVAQIMLEIANLDTLSIKIDGQQFDYEPARTFTEFESESSISTSSTQIYNVPSDLPSRMVAGKDVRVKLGVGQSEYVEGLFHVDRPSAAIRGFRNFTSDGP